LRGSCNVDHGQRLGPKVRKQQGLLIGCNRQLARKHSRGDRSHNRIFAAADLLGIDDSDGLRGVAVAKTVGVGHGKPRSTFEDCHTDWSIADWNPDQLLVDG
jgi:hypothetical protein